MSKSVLSSVCECCDNVFKAWCFLSRTCRMSKSNNQIQAIQQLIKASKISTTLLFNWETNVWASSLTMKNTLYKYAWTFLSAFSSLWHSCLSASYLDFEFVQTPLSYWQTWQHQLFFAFYIRQNPHSFLLEFMVNIISFASEL